jgi:hypothetical protein
MQRIPRIALAHVPPGAAITRVERMSRAFVKYHLDDGQILHRFTREEPHADPHDHPFAFTTMILTGGYVEEVFHPEPGGRWRAELVHRRPGTMHRIPAAHIHRIVGLPGRECWTLTRYHAWERHTHFWRFGEEVHRRHWRSRRWVRHG